MAQRPAAPTLSPAPGNNKLAYLEFDVPTDGEPTHAAVPCGHLCLCAACAREALERCPICRTPLVQTMRVFTIGRH